MSLTTDRSDPELGYGSDSEPVPQNKKYLVLSDEELEKGYVRPLRDRYYHLICGAITTMNYTIAATYARQPNFYGATYCVKCSKHRPVGENGEFVWCDEHGNPTDEKVGT